MKKTMISLWEDTGFEFLICYLGFIGGISLLVVPTTPNSVQSALPHWVVNMWAIQLITGCGLVMLALLIKNPILRIRLETTGLILLVPASTIYFIIVIATLQLRGVFPGVPYLLFAVVCLGRVTRLLTISRELSKYRK